MHIKQQKSAKGGYRYWVADGIAVQAWSPLITGALMHMLTSCACLLLLFASGLLALPCHAIPPLLFSKHPLKRAHPAPLRLSFNNATCAMYPSACLHSSKCASPPAIHIIAAWMWRPAMPSD
eukprot:1158636-Pelagomonas_calceolata.AAC.1